MTNFLLLLILAALWPFSSAAPPGPPNPSLPLPLIAPIFLPLIPRSNWLNVLTYNGSFSAKGDGISDDSQAVQRAFDVLTSDESGQKIVYFPPGIYRISATLRLTNKVRTQLIGHGSSSVLEWAGPSGSSSTLLLSDGNSDALFTGLTYEGRGLAYRAVLHSAQTTFEARIRHEYCSFLNFAIGIQAGGAGELLASSEQEYHNNLFINNTQYGLLIRNPNYYNHQISQCDFYSNRIAISMIYFAQGSIRKCHFCNSSYTDMDIGQPSFSHSIRSCSSIFSRRFLSPTSYRAKFNFQHNVIESWNSPAEGIFQTTDNFPRPILDNLFINPPVIGSRPLQIRADQYAAPEKILSNNRLRQSGISGGEEKNLTQIILNSSKSPYYALPEDYRQYSPNIPQSGDISWRETRPRHMASTIFDVTKDFGVFIRNLRLRTFFAKLQYR